MTRLEYCKTRKGYWRKANGTEEALSELSDEHLNNLRNMLWRWIDEADRMSDWSQYQEDLSSAATDKIFESLEEGIRRTNRPTETPNAARDWYRAKVSK